MVLYYKGVSTAEVAIVSPMEVGGLKSDEYRRLNPQGARESGLPGGVCVFCVLKGK